MARQEKNTRARGLPPRVLLSQRQDATGSFPTVWRTSSDNRTGRYNISFNDNKVVTFNQYEAADYDSNFLIKAASDVAAGVRYVEKVEDVGYVPAGGSKTFSYTTPFPFNPIVVITEISSSNNSHGVNAFLSGILDENSFTVKFSSEFNGSIVYRAVYDPSPETLRVVERKPRYPNAFTRFVAKELTLVDTNTADITFNDFGDDTAENFVTFRDKSGNGQSDIWPNITTQTRTLVALTASSIATSIVEYERFHGLHNRGIIYPLGMNQATILAGLSVENQIEMYGSVSFISGAVVNQPTKWIVASGSMKKNVADTFITFTPGQDIQAFRDNSNPAVDGKRTNNPFYATGSAVTVTGEGFQQPLWSKSKIEIDITPSAEQTFTLYKSASAGSYPMGYWNPNTRLYEGIGTGKGIDSYPNSLDGLKQHLEEQTFGFAASINGTGVSINNFNEGEFNLLGRQIGNYGFPYHPKFQPSSSQKIPLLNYISEPFLLEKLVIEISGGLAVTTNYVGGTDTAIWTFFLLNSRPNLLNRTSPEQSISYTNGTPSSPSTFVTSSLLSDKILDLIDFQQIAISSSLDYLGFLGKREQVIQPWLNWNSQPPASTTGSFQFKMESIVKSQIQYSDGIPATFSGSFLEPPYGSFSTFIQNNPFPGRNSVNNANGRDWFSSFEKPNIAGVGVYTYIGTFISYSLNINDAYTKSNPYILLPTDQLTFGFQLPLDADNVFLNTNFGFATSGINKITLYGSTLRVNPETNQLEEYHDTLNQLLSSESIHEVITG